MALIVIDKILHVLKQKGLGLVMFDDACDIKEKSSLRLVREAVGTAQGVLLTYAGDAERLARESCQ
ncbi:hypothetical protein D3C80_2018130 [compost metagenome]